MTLRAMTLLVLAGLISTSARAEWFRFSGSAMTTPIEMEFWAADRDQAERLSRQVFAEFDRIDHRMSRYREDSELSRVNRQAADAPVVVSDDLYRVFEQARRVSELSDGAFDISFGSVGYFYDYRRRIQPSEQELAHNLPRINYRDIELDPEDRSVHFRQTGLLTDLGGIAKGFAVDRGIELLRAGGIRHARLSAGGDMRLLGDRRGRPWVVGVRDPRREDTMVVRLPLADVAISTSGDYERFFIDDSGTRVHHIIAPSSGRPAEGVQSVTILGDRALVTDGLSTAVFVLGAEQGLVMINRLPGIDAIIIDDQRQLHYSEGLMPPAGP